MQKILTAAFWISDDDKDLFQGLALGLGAFLMLIAAACAAIGLAWGALNLVSMIWRRLFGG
jgi:hypothetical protein